MPDRVFFIINKYSGKGFQASVEGEVIDACSRQNVKCVIEYTRDKGHATVLARYALQHGFKRVFAMGGDGTVNEVAQALVHSDASLGIIPTGSGNGLARHLKIPLKFKSALRLLGEHHVLKMDTLMLNGLLSVNVAGIGFDAHVASKFGKNGKRGLMGYAKLVTQEFNRFNEFEVEASTDHATGKYKSFILALANSSQFGNNAKVSPSASVSDGLMDICFVRKVPMVQLVPFIARMFSGQADRSRYVDIVKTRTFRAEVAEPVPFHIDGEPHNPTRVFEAVVLPGTLRVIVP